MNTTGIYWEQRAVELVTASGGQVLARNFHCRFGEIDLIVIDKYTLAFIEVRYRRHCSFGAAAESVSLRKQNKVIRAASIFLIDNDCHNTRRCRFDIIAFDGARRSARVKWLKGAFNAAE
ncbi:MAG: YraN family protein [Alteromonadaceae bacterium]|nr:YraN family protein [Alteromonadaceae bacterium]MBL6703507.1 YraN family protein [Pseudomonadales bacterium]MBL6824005.1 YraN family protein [Luminiphilus sp.]RCL47349.1 MAG: YraN family protein [Halieaceae bacterium]RPH10005.1 MAG: YraN family protein [Alteromonadaceae bacterium TMED101]